MTATMKRFPKTKAALAAKPAANGHALEPDVLDVFLGGRLNDLPAVTGTLAGVVHLKSLQTIGQVVGLAGGQHQVFDALMQRGLNTNQTDVLMGAIEAAWRKVGGQGEPWGQAQRSYVSPRPQEPAPADAPPARPIDALPIVQIPLSQISPCPLNPRKTFDQAKLFELAESVKSKGVLQPVLVRSVVHKLQQKIEGRDSPVGYELIFGERRFRACLFAELATIPARVVDWDDAEVLEVMVVENAQRDDLPPLEEAEGYFQLLSLTKTSVEEIAKKVGKSTSYVYQLLKLRGLPPAARAALAAGEIPVTVAQLIARIPGDKLKTEAAKRILKGGRFEGRGGRWHHLDKGPLTLRDARELVESEYMVELKGAPFDRTSLDLVPSVGACTTCPKMAGNNRQEFPGARADLCTDPLCYDDKAKAHQARLLADAKAAGKKVLQGKAADQALGWNSAYRDLANMSAEVKKLATGELKEAVAVCVDRRGKVHELLPRSDVDHALRRSARPASRLSAEQKNARVKKIEAGKKQNATVKVALQEIALAAPVVSGPRAKEILLWICKDKLQSLGSGATALLCRVHGLKGNYAHERSAALCKRAAEQDAQGILGMLLQAYAVRRLHFAGGNAEAIKACGLEWKKIAASASATWPQANPYGVYEGAKKIRIALPKSLGVTAEIRVIQAAPHTWRIGIDCNAGPPDHSGRSHAPSKSGNGHATEMLAIQAAGEEILAHIRRSDQTSNKKRAAVLIQEWLNRRLAVEMAQTNGKHPAREPDPAVGKSARAKRRKLHPEEAVPEPAVAGDAPLRRTVFAPR